MCYRFPRKMRSILGALPCPTLDAMDAVERRYLGSLPESIEIWRGCCNLNRDGLSWTTKRKKAEWFATRNHILHRRIPELLRGTVNRDDILFVKVARREFEIVPRPGMVTVTEEIKVRVSI